MDPLPSGTPAYLASPPGAQRGLVVIPDIWGLRPLFTEMCDDLSVRTGWSVGSFDPFGGDDLPGADEAEGFPRRSDALRNLDDASVLGDAMALADSMGLAEVGLIGFCMGGMYALKSSATARFDRVVGFYGIIRVPTDWEGGGQGQPLDALASRGDCEVMAVVGTVDPWTPPDQVDELEGLGVNVLRYEGADHGFVHDPSRPAHRPDDAADAWSRALEFLGHRAPTG
ncbi:MAG: dienelactone hydrolase family protein [Microthrixaceae bacterium]